MEHRSRDFALLLLLSGASILGSSPALATTAGPVTELGASMSAFSQRAPSISWDGTRYVMVWEDGRNNAATGVDLYLARFDASGALLDMNGLPLLTPGVPENQTQPQIIYNPLAATHVIVWTDGRGSDSNIYAARFVPGSGSVLEQNGAQITTETDPDAQPTVACTADNCLFAWQSAIGGASEVRARRFTLQLNAQDAMPVAISSAPATSESKPRALTTAGTYFLAWEDDRNTATSGLDIFARTLPVFDPLTAVAGTPIVTALLRQTEADIAVLGNALEFVWQDQRNGTLIDDIWGHRFDTSLASLSNEGPINASANDQLRPRIAADSVGGLVVWQDRRSGAFGFTYGARLNGTGALRDLEGFPLITANANVFEHAVAKGPNNDYLVAAVRFDGTPRIFYRIVRDEPPASAMTASGTLQVPADGTASAMPVFGPARGATPPMYDVVDGTLYTVTLSRQDVTIDPPDVAPLVPGHQVFAVQGNVGFGLTSLEHGPVTVTVASVEGTSTGQATIIFDNVPPVASNVVAGPPAPSSSEDLFLTYSYSDINGDPEMGTTIEWTRNSAIQAAYTNQLTVPASATSRGDQWRARVTPRDGMNAGGFVFSNTIIIGNTAPRALDVRIMPDMGVLRGTDLHGRYIFDDEDSDPQGPQTVLRWYDHDIEVPALLNATDVPGSMVVKGQVWTFSVQPHDNYESGPVVFSSTVTVANTIPVASAGTAGVVIERRRYMLDATESHDDDAADVLTYSWTQLQGPTVSLSSTSSVTPSFTAPSVTGTVILQFEVIVNDGDDDSPPSRVVVEISPVRDTDNDGLDDEEEMAAGTDPTRADTDRDGFGDAAEVAAHTDPNDEDSDDDGVRDGVEGRACFDCTPAPLDDSDGDLIIAVLDPDGDNDLVLDGTEAGIRAAIEGTNVNAGNFVADADPETTTDPTRPDTDGDTLSDGVEDANHNGRIDSGESDPNDPSDPPVACTPGGNQCPPGTECDNGTCRIPTIVDGGLMCRPLAEQRVECCMGGCQTGTSVAPECVRQGALEQCPAGAQQCGLGSCSGNMPDPMGESGCQCSATAPASSSGGISISIVVLLLALLRFTPGSSDRRER